MTNGAGYWTHLYAEKRKARFTVVNLRQEPEPLVVDFEIVGWLGRTCLFRFHWRDDDGTVVLDRYTQGSDEPISTEDYFKGVSSAHSGYNVVEDTLDDEDFWAKMTNGG